MMSELVAQLTKQLEGEGVSVACEDRGVGDGERPNLDRLTVGVDLGDQWSNYCILGLGGENPDRGSVQDESAGDSGVLSRSVPIACGDRSGNAFGVGAGGDRRTCHEVRLPMHGGWKDPSGAGARTTGLMPPSWLGWVVWIRNRCIR